MVTVVAVALLLMQVDVVEAGSRVEQGVIEQEALQMQNPEPLPAFDRDPVDFDGIGTGGGQLLIELMVAPLGPLADQATLGSVVVDEDLDIQLGTSRLGGIERREDLASRLIVLQIEGDQIDASLRARDQLQNALLEVARRVENAQAVRLQCKLRQFLELLSIMCRSEHTHT